MTFCPYHGSDHENSTIFSDEHILPYAIGGSDDLTIKVCKSANDKCGTLIDAPLINNFFITLQRLIHGTAGHTESPPVWTVKGSVEINGKTHQCVYRMRHGGYKNLFINPVVEWEIEPDGLQRVHIECGEKQLQTILKDINSKASRKGIMTIDLDSILLTAQRQIIRHPRINFSVYFDFVPFQLAFAKMALGLAHFVIGERYSRSPEADLIRKFIWERDNSVRETIPLIGQIWPDGSPGLERILAYKDWHTLAILNNEKLVFAAILFGKYYGIVKLSDTANYWVEPNWDDAIFLINPVTRYLKTFSFSEYIMFISNV